MSVILILFRWSHPQNAWSLMVVTELGMVTCCRLVQALNRALEIVVSELGRTIDSR